MNFFVLKRKPFKNSITYYKSISYINNRFKLNLKEEDLPYTGLLDKYIIIDKC